jgi:hypothetical protein
MPPPEETGFCYKCGHQIKKGLFCSDKHKQQWERDQDRQIRRGKRAGYGLAGSCR